MSQGRSDENAMDVPGTMEPQVKGTEDWYDGLGYCMHSHQDMYIS